MNKKLHTLTDELEYMFKNSTESELKVIYKDNIWFDKALDRAKKRIEYKNNQRAEVKLNQ